MSHTEKVKKAETPNEMRAELERLSYFDPLLRNVFDAAGYGGMSGEDKYAILSYYAVKRIKELESLVLEYHMLHPAPSLIFKE